MLKRVLNHTFIFFRFIFALIFFHLTNINALGADCTTTSDNTWSCGTPSPSDNLTVFHTVTINSDFDLIGSITVNIGGHLTITGSMLTAGATITVNPGGTLIVDGNMILTSNTHLAMNGNMNINNSLTIQNSSTVVTGGDFYVDGNVLIEQGGVLNIESIATFTVNGNFESNSNAVNIDGTLDIDGDFINDKSMNGTGNIYYDGKCSGVGTLNGYDPSLYCGGGYIDMDNLACIATDVIPPVISYFPSNRMAYLPDNACEISINWASPDITDNCALDAVTSTHNSGDLFQIGATTVTYTATDKAGNSISNFFTITVMDTISPTISNLPSDMMVDATIGLCGANVSWTEPTATDNCSASMNADHISGDFFPIGITKVTYTATDPSGNMTSKSFNVEVVNTIPPVITNCPADQTVYVPSGSCDIQVSWTEPTADGCGVTMTQTHNPGDVFTAGVHTVSYNFTDGSGNSSVCSFTVSVLDTITPTITNIPADLVVDAAGACEAAVSWTEPTATDNCSAGISSDYAPNDLFPIGITTVTYTATDPSGNQTSKSFLVEVINSASMTINNCPADQTVYVPSGSCDVAVSWTVPTADGCGVNMTSSHDPGDIFATGMHSVTYDFTDGLGNSSTCSFTVTVLDTISPVISNLPSDFVVDATSGQCGANVSWAAPMATDNCSANMSSDHTPGDFFPVGSTTVNYTAIDPSGNVIQRSFGVTVEDHTPPIFTSCPGTFTVIMLDTATRTSVITWTEPIADDACSSVSLSSNYNSGDTFNFGIILVEYTAIDANGNQSTCSFEVESGINLSPTAENSVRKAKAGESIDIQLNVSDPEGDQIFIENILNNEMNSVISNIDDDRLSFTYTSMVNFHGFDTVYVLLVDDGLPNARTSAEVVVEVERETQIEVSEILTTNGDQINDTWLIKNIDMYPENTVHIFNRWGGLLYKGQGYDNNLVVWDGTSSEGNLGSKEYVPTGTYFYVIDLGKGEKKITGAIEIVR